MKTGIDLITEERLEQIEKHKWDLDNKCYQNEELLKAALFCIDQRRFEWPRSWMSIFRQKIVNKNRVDQLKVAGAFIAAEIDRLQLSNDTQGRQFPYTEEEIKSFGALRAELIGCANSDLAKMKMGMLDWEELQIIKEALGNQSKDTSTKKNK